MQIRVLGPIDVEVGGLPVQLGGPKQRSVLALLALHVNSAVSVDRLIEGLWGEEQPASAAKMVQLYVSQLRKLLAEEDGTEIVTHGRGYELRADRDVVDAERFERLVAEASRARGNGTAGRRPRGALALWRGPPLADLLDEPFAAAEARRLEELHLAALELSIESELEAGGHAELVGRLETLVAEYPLSERLQALRMLALYRAGRQAEALEAYRSARAALVEEIGVEPGPELRRLHEAMLRQDPALELVVPGVAWTRRETSERVGEEAGRAATQRGEVAHARGRARLRRGRPRRAARSPRPSRRIRRPARSRCRCARSRALRRSTSPTRTTSSAASASSPRSSRGSSARASLPWWARPAAGSRRSSAQGCSRPWPGACSPEASGGVRSSCGRGSIRSPSSGAGSRGSVPTSAWC